MVAHIYKTHDGKRVPSVTTVLGRFKESGGLIHWAWSLGIEGKGYRAARDDAANAGTLAHEMIDRHLRGLDPTVVDGPDDTIALARIGFDAFSTWMDQTKLKVSSGETPLVSERYRFGGTLDAIGLCNGRRALIDWKSSNRIYADYLVQVAAYRLLWEEHHPDEPIEDLHLLRVGKEHGDFHHHSWPVSILDLGAKAFIGMLELYEIDKQLRKAAGV